VTSKAWKAPGVTGCWAVVHAASAGLGPEQRLRVGHRRPARVHGGPGGELPEALKAERAGVGSDEAAAAQGGGGGLERVVGEAGDAIGRGVGREFPAVV
jgi:hypothetical protein